MSKQLKQWYYMAHEKFKIKDEYTKNKTKQDFISSLEEHFKNNIKDNRIIYNGKETEISNIKIEWNGALKEKDDTLKLNSFSILISALTIVASMSSTTFLGDKAIPLYVKTISAAILAATYYFILLGINVIEKSLNRGVFYNHTFYQISLDVLEKVENLKKVTS